MFKPPLEIDQMMVIGEVLRSLS